MKKTFRFLKWSGNKAVAVFLSMCLTLAIVGTTLAIIIVRTNPLENRFSPSDLDIAIVGNDIKNTGDVPVYVRAAVVANWIGTEDGSVLSTTPARYVDYTMSINETDWFLGSDGFYYCGLPLAAGATANSLVGNATAVTVKDGYTLQLQIIASGIQAAPDEAVQTSWPAVRVDGGHLVKAN